jgi:hypothetical protein
MENLYLSELGNGGAGALGAHLVELNQEHYHKDNGENEHEPLNHRLSSLGPRNAFSTASGLLTIV